MAYAEFLRVRTSMAWHAAILAAITLTLLYFAGGHVHVDGTIAMSTGSTMSFGQLAPIAMFFAAIFASSQGTSLVLALQYIAVDVAGIIVAFALTMAAIAIVLVRAHITPVADPTLPIMLALGCGVAVMWYSLIQVLTFWFASGARSVAGILWPVALLGLGLGHLDGPFGAIMRGINVINPLAYMSGVHFTASGASQDAVTTLPMELRPLAVWLFAALFCAIAVTLWPKKEA